MNEFEFLSKEDFNNIPNRSNRKNKNRLFYSWKLERFANTISADFEVAIFPSKSKASGIQIIKFYLLKAINSSNLFDFQYSPKEKDYLSIINLSDKDEFLLLIYINGSWIEEEYLNASRNYFDQFIELENGYLEIK